MRLLIAPILFLWWLSLNAKEADFISDFEYGLALYKNPRGVACAKCHGIKGEQQEITFYYEKGEKKSSTPLKSTIWILKPLKTL